MLLYTETDKYINIQKEKCPSTQLSWAAKLPEVEHNDNCLCFTETTGVKAMLTQ